MAGLGLGVTNTRVRPILCGWGPQSTSCLMRFTVAQVIAIGQFAMKPGNIRLVMQQFLPELWRPFAEIRSPEVFGACSRTLDHVGKTDPVLT